MKEDEIQWHGEPDWYESSPIARRPYCRECGTSLGFAFTESSGTMDITVASFDDPSRFKPTHHFGAESIHLAWLNTEGLKEIRTEEQHYAFLQDKEIPESTRSLSTSGSPPPDHSPAEASAGRHCNVGIRVTFALGDEDALLPHYPPRACRGAGSTTGRSSVRTLVKCDRRFNAFLDCLGRH